MGLSTYGKEWGLPAFLAGVTAFVYYAFGALPLHIGVSQQLGLTPGQTSSWVFIVWFSGAVWTICLCFYFRQPIPITWTVPGLIYLGTLAGQFDFAEIVGGNVMAALLFLLLALLRMGERIMKWLPLPIVMGMFGGSIFNYVTRTVGAVVDDLAVAGVTVAGYLVGRAIGNRKIPPVGLAVVFGGVAVAISSDLNMAAIPWALPEVAVPEMRFSLPAFVAISLPLVVLAMGLGNVQGLGFLLAQGYRVPLNVISIATAICSIINAFFGGHTATVARIGAALIRGGHRGRARARASAGVRGRARRGGDSRFLSGCSGKGLRWADALRRAHGLCRGRDAVRHFRDHFGLLGGAGRAGGIAAGRAAGAARLLERGGVRRGGGYFTAVKNEWWMNLGCRVISRYPAPAMWASMAASGTRLSRVGPLPVSSPFQSIMARRPPGFSSR
jgi:benzoate membrane transport protein